MKEKRYAKQIIKEAEEEIEKYIKHEIEIDELRIVKNEIHDNLFPKPLNDLDRMEQVKILQKLHFDNIRKYLNTLITEYEENVFFDFLTYEYIEGIKNEKNKDEIESLIGSFLKDLIDWMGV